MSRVFSIVQFFPEDEGHKCGYCKSNDGFISQGMWAHVLNVEEYQQLLDRGWRRSGKYCYKPVMSRTCCPLYTIRCDALSFVPSKSQKKVMKRMRSFLLGNYRKTSSDDRCFQCDSADADISSQVANIPMAISLSSLDNISSIDVATFSTADSDDSTQTGNTQTLSQTASPAVLKNEHGKVTSGGCGGGQKKLQRRLRWQQKHPGQQLIKPSQPASLEQLLQLPADAKHILEIRLVRTHPANEQYLDSRHATHALYQRYQSHVHKEPEDKCSLDNYQRFLEASPLQADAPLGSYHQQYWLDGRLIAVGVLDLLPHCVSSKYFIYDPDFSFLSLGTYASLREIELVRQLHVNTATMQYYYLGYYIHTCAKMRYKGNYKPSWLLCPETLSWQPVELCTPLLDINKYSRLTPTLQGEEGSVGESEVSLDCVRVLYRGVPLTYQQYLRARSDAKISSSKLALIRQYVRLVGESVASRTLFYIT